MLRKNFKQFLAASMVFSTLFTTTAFATPIDLVNSAQDVQYDSLYQDAGTTYYDDESTNEWSDGTIPEEVRVKVDLASQFTITIPKEIILDGSTGKADYVVNAKGDIAGDQVLVVEPDNEFSLSEKGGKEDITATVVQPDTEYVYTDLQGDGTNYNGTITATLSAGEWAGKFNFNIRFNEQGLPESGQPLESYSWDEIAQISEAGLADEYFNIGDEKKVTLNSTSTASLNTLADTEEGETYTLQIIGFNHDDLADGSGKAGITFQFKEVLNNTNISSRNADTYLQNNFNTIIPLELQNSIKSVIKTTYSANGTKNISDKKLFLLSETEVLGFQRYCPYIEGNLYDYFKTEGNTMKYDLSGKLACWWLRSIRNSNDTCCVSCGVGNPEYFGYVSYCHIDGNGCQRYLAPAFCI